MEEAFQFIIEHGDDIAKLALVLKSVLDVIFAILRRHDISPLQQKSESSKKAVKSPKSKSKQKLAKEQPTIIIKVGDIALSIPTTHSREQSFIVQVTKPKARPKKASR